MALSTTYSEVKTPFSEIRMRFFTCITIIMLSNDNLNPIKAICGTLELNPLWFAWLSFAFAVVIVYANGGELVYFTVKIFFRSVLSIFFSSIEIYGKENIPRIGPAIFTSNHNNQFVDGAMVVATNPFQVSFLVAEKSMKKRIIGDFARAVGGISVKRPQDCAKAGEGKVMFEGMKLRGDKTKFTALQSGDKIMPGKSAASFKIKEIYSDTEALLSEEFGEPSPLSAGEFQNHWVEFSILGQVDQGLMFEAVQSSLAKGKCLGIFPEGGSHDNTDLLPLKVGVASIALGVLEKFDVNVPIVPVGLNYYRGHRFRGRVVIEYGEPIHITKELFQLYKESRRKAYQALLLQVEEGIRSVIITADDRDQLNLIHAVRRLYQRTSAMTGPSETRLKQDLTRRFSIGIKLIKEKNNGELPADIVALGAKVKNYLNELERWGLKDYQVNNLDIPYTRSIQIFMHGLVVMLLASVPALILNAPVGFVAKYLAEREAKKDLLASRVKVEALDVLLSKKIYYSMVMVPALWVSYALVLHFLTPLSTKAVVLLFLMCPFFSYVGVMAVEAGMIDMKDLRPAFLRLLPSFQGQATLLPRMRSSLQKEVRRIVKKYGPDLGSLYYGNMNEWTKDLKKSS